MTVCRAPFVLASSSPRRMELLQDAGIAAIPCPPEIDDGVFICGKMDVHRWVETLAVMKAQYVQSLVSESHGTILAADTVCVVDDDILGQPVCAEDARDMITRMTNREHEVCTGWSVISIDGEHLQSGCDVSRISIGKIENDEIDKYIETGSWQGKAGGYNLSERIAAHWPIECDGDETSVMGLPMNILKQVLGWGK